MYPRHILCLHSPPRLHRKPALRVYYLSVSDEMQHSQCIRYIRRTKIIKLITYELMYTKSYNTDSATYSPLTQTLVTVTKFLLGTSIS
jgi:hypothetical protein